MKRERESAGNLIALDIGIDNNRVILINIYGPNDDQPVFYQGVKDILMESDSLFHIVCGDSNISLNQNLGTDNYKHINNPKSRDILLKMMSELDLIDYYRVLHQTSKSFT